ncbi:MAG TPA: MgtC/SapB family protein [Candidatus Sumerlaeota bacterium]|nr:MAG: putative Mg(2+) transport ATPase [candidate division BRC1 bacterium ADurb.BinA292]HOE96150.1 MgtC/SapB family protein [Candidatus Sumerlaeota bacterium]HOR27775.1 MgtC/SapB family protein [Candidatus Sumerlaeota bacterium]HPK02515.1 MgtC/SapB family protein [Candidatus Sumerlaeota bacterium]
MDVGQLGEQLVQWLNFESRPLDVILRLSMAALCGGIIGWDREREDKPAGLRTHMMVALGAAAFMVLTVEVSRQTTGFAYDPVRTVAGIAGGLGFLGAGTIIQSRHRVEGVTTAAGIWVVGALGTICGAGLYGVALLTTILAFIILTVVQFFKLRVLHLRAQPPAHKPD